MLLTAHQSVNLYSASLSSHHSLIIYITRADVGVQVAHHRKRVPVIGAPKGRLQPLFTDFHSIKHFSIPFFLIATPHDGSHLLSLSRESSISVVRLSLTAPVIMKVASSSSVALPTASHLNPPVGRVHSGFNVGSHSCTRHGFRRSRCQFLIAVSIAEVLFLSV